MTQDIEVQDAAVHEGRDSVLTVFVKVAAVWASTTAALILAAILGQALGQDILNGMPWDQLQGRMLTAAAMLIPAVVLIVVHRRPSLLMERPAWLNGPIIASGSVIWLLTCQATFSTLGV